MRYSIEPPGACADEETYLSIKHDMAVQILDDAEVYKNKDACVFLIEVADELNAHRLPADFYPHLFRLLGAIKNAPPEARNAQRNDSIWTAYILHRSHAFGKPMPVEPLYQMIAERFGITEDSVKKIVKAKKRELRKGEKSI